MSETLVKPAVEEGTLPILTVSGYRAEIRLNRPKVLNRLQPEDVLALRKMFSQINNNPEIRVLVLTGTGRVFSSGFHLGDLAQRRASSDAPVKAEELQDSPDNFGAMTVELENLRVPTICRLNGSVYGGATDLALSCDFRIGMQGTEMFMPAARLGLHYYSEGLVRWSHRLAPGAARKLFLTAKTISAEEMLRVGYLTELRAPENLDKTVDEWAENLAAMAPRAVEGMKQALNEIDRGEFDRVASDARNAASLSSEDVREGLAAWHEKRSPVFVGR
ncbi:Crotonyl-CoA hydratase [Pseudomonas fluorescens]|uniref:Crotonyl-CoA hydratase n=1 Tax=Pseudomonas fluorescens TaxID=294 RepID=A0A5E6SF36_PSEFL|nr:enoyl-CoA hydratase/isomerase family protein [Pseudomonas fluorescens]VVM79516.1 Crotonyl-CoA hydratase [Pseudomonas fluorescens]